MGLLEILLGIIVIFIKAVILFAATALVMAYLTYFERKISGHIQVRYGPMRVGSHGWLQPIADGLKFFLKEDIVPAQADWWVYVLSPCIVLITAFTVVAALPLGENLFGGGQSALANLNVGIIFVLAISSLGVYGIVMAGWASNSKYALLGGLRSAAQMISYEIPLGMALVGPLMISDSLNMGDIVRAQAGSWLPWLPEWIIPKWFLFVQPVAFFIYCFCALAETNRLPFDLPEAESELVAGYHTEYSGMKFAFFFMGEYVNMLVVSGIATVAFLGGWDQPSLPLWVLFCIIPVALSIRRRHWHGFFPLVFVFGSLLILATQFGLFNRSPFDLAWPLVCLFWFLVKIAFFIYAFMWIRWTFPRLRYDQLMGFGWYWMLPLSLLNIVATGVVRYLVS